MNKEISTNNEYVDLLLAVRRHKENPLIKGEICFREVLKSETSLLVLKTKIANYPGIWRIYKSINKRDTRKAVKLLQKTLIDNPEHWKGRIDSLWKTCLLQRECRAEKKMLIDLDTNDKDIYDKVIELIGDKLVLSVKSPNGYNIVTEMIDTRLFDEFKNVTTFNRDGYVFLERITIGE